MPRAHACCRRAIDHAAQPLTATQAMHKITRIHLRRPSSLSSSACTAQWHCDQRSCDQHNTLLALVQPASQEPTRRQTLLQAVAHSGRLQPAAAGAGLHNQHSHTWSVAAATGAAPNAATAIPVHHDRSYRIPIMRPYSCTAHTAHGMQRTHELQRFKSHHAAHSPSSFQSFQQQLPACVHAGCAAYLQTAISLLTAQPKHGMESSAALAIPNLCT